MSEQKGDRLAKIDPTRILSSLFTTLKNSKKFDQSKNELKQQ